MAIVIRTARNVRIDAKLYATHIALYCQVMRKSMAELVKHEARLLARDVADMYPPFSGSAPQITKGGEGGFGNIARDKGRSAVNRDVRKIFAPLDQASGGVIASRGDPSIFYDWVRAKMEKPTPSLPVWLMDEYKATGGLFGMDVFKRFVESRKGNFGGDGNVMLHESEGQIGAIHRLARGRDNYKVAKNRKPDFFINDWQLVEKYIKRVQQRVGKLKAGWYTAGARLGKMPTSAWVRDQGSNNAILEPHLTGPYPKIYIGNKIGKRGSGWHFFQKAWNHRGFAMREKILHALKGPKNRGRLMDVISKLKGGFELSDK